MPGALAETLAEEFYTEAFFPGWLLLFVHHWLRSVGSQAGELAEFWGYLSLFL